MNLGTVGSEEFWRLALVLPWLEVIVMTVFLLASIRMWQAAPDRSALRLGIGFGLLLAAKLYDASSLAGMIPMNYFPGYKSGLWGLPATAVDWWEPLLWWGQWAVRLCGWAFAGLGFFTAGRRLVREARERHLEPFSPQREGGL